MTDIQIPTLPWQAGEIINVASRLYPDIHDSFKTIMAYGACKNDSQIYKLSNKMKQQQKQQALYQGIHLDRAELWFNNLYDRFSLQRDELNIAKNTIDDFLIGLNWLYNHSTGTMEALSTGFNVQQNLYTLNFGKEYYDIPSVKGEDCLYQAVNAEEYLTQNSPQETLTTRTAFTKTEIIDHFDEIIDQLKNNSIDQVIIEPREVPQSSFDRRHQKLPYFEFQKRRAKRIIKRVRQLQDRYYNDYEDKAYIDDQYYYLLGFMYYLLRKAHICETYDQIYNFLDDVLQKSCHLEDKQTFYRSSDFYEENIGVQVADYILNAFHDCILDTPVLLSAIINYFRKNYMLSNRVKVIKSDDLITNNSVATDEIKQRLKSELADWLDKKDKEIAKEKYNDRYPAGCLWKHPKGMEKFDNEIGI